MTLTLIKYIALAASIFCVTAEAQRPRWSAYRYRVQGLVGFYGYEQGGTAPKDFLTTSTATLYADAYVGAVTGSDTASGAIHFDGTGDYASYTTASEHRSMGNELTLFCRQKKDDGADYLYLMRWGKSGSSNRYLNNVYNGTYLAYLYAFGVDYTPVHADETSEHTVATTHTETTDNQLTYVDGLWVNTLFTGSGTVRYHADEVQVQATWSGTSSFGDGWISEFRVYNYALTAAELMKLHQEGDHK